MASFIFSVIIGQTKSIFNNSHNEIKFFDARTKILIAVILIVMITGWLTLSFLRNFSFLKAKVTLEISHSV